MGLNTRIGKVADATVALLVVTWTANEPTAAATQTIADGTVPTVAELGQYAANNQTVVDALVADMAALRAQLNAGE